MCSVRFTDAAFFVTALPTLSRQQFFMLRRSSPFGGGGDLAKIRRKNVCAGRHAAKDPQHRLPVGDLLADLAARRLLSVSQ
jgi:hypothetical protein